MQTNRLLGFYPKNPFYREMQVKSSYVPISQKNDYNDYSVERYDFSENPVCSWGDISIIHDKLSDKIFRLPPDLKELAAEIEASRYILDLEKGWDGENAEPYHIHVWERVVEFLIRMYLTSVRLFDVIPDFPKIYHGPEGTIDILWEKSDYQILANCPKEEDKQVSFYGENSKKNSFKGSFCMRDNYHSLLMILVGIKKCGI